MSNSISSVDNTPPGNNLTNGILPYCGECPCDVLSEDPDCDTYNRDEGLYWIGNIIKPASTSYYPGNEGTNNYRQSYPGFPYLRIQSGNAKWTNAGCGTFKVNDPYYGGDKPSAIYQGTDSMFTSFIKIRTCSSSSLDCGCGGEGDDCVDCGKKCSPQTGSRVRESLRTYTYDSEDGCEGTLTAVSGKQCEDKICGSFPTGNIGTRYKNFSGAVTATSMWATINSSISKNYDFDENVYGGVRSANQGGYVVASWSTNKSFANGSLQGHVPKFACKIYNLITGQKYVFGYSIYRRALGVPSSTPYSLVSSPRSEFTATGYSKEFGSIVEDPEDGYSNEAAESNYNAMTSISLPNDAGYEYRMWDPAVMPIYEGRESNCEKWINATPV